ncbi:MAG: polyketide synthase dehydratase domain-containing protein [Pirellulales bacterium]|nr:polyketide synthase dehydratase domain-containing protein [Pirellulales bacterium]
MSSPPAARSPVRTPEDIAIVGMACFLPGADSAGRFWQNIVDRVDAVGDPPADWQPDLFLNPADPTRSYTGRGGYLRDLCRFNPARYGIMPSSIEGSEPDHFLAFRAAVEALADAGYPQIPLVAERTGVILGRGIFINRGLVTMIAQGYMIDQVLEVLRQLEPHRSEEDLLRLRDSLKAHMPPFNAETVPGLTHNVLAARIANRLNLQGPTYTVDAACASALLAVDQSIRELRAGRCDAVLAGGVQVSTPGLVHKAFSYLGALSRKGTPAPFSADADGTLLGQGCGVIVLKRRSDAERDGNRIYALLKSVGVSSDGKALGLLAPRQEGQELSIRRAYEQSGCDIASVGLIEAHATGIPLGDATEIRSLSACFGTRQGPKPNIAVGSVKSMISHLIPASGAASLIKTALALYHRVLPPMLHAERPNPELDIDSTPFYLNTEPRPWIHGDRETPRRAAIDAFGFGGINAHALLEEHPAADEATLTRLERRWPAELVVISAADRAELASRVEQIAIWLDQSSGIELLDVAASAACLSGPAKLTLVARDLDDLRKKLAAASRYLAEPDRTKIQDRSGIFWQAEPLAATGRVAFVFPGEGAQYTGMLADLCRHFPEVRREFDLTDAAFARSTFGQPLSRLIFPLPSERESAENDLLALGGAVTSVTLASRGLLALLKTLNLRADSIIGHSSGEFGALLAAGAIAPASDDELIQVLADGANNAVALARSGRVPPAVLTAVGGADPQAVAQVLASSNGKLRVAMDNCPSQVILSGDESATEAALEQLRGKGGLCERLPWGRAYHTADFAPAVSIIEEYFDSVPLAEPTVEMWSCSSAGVYPREVPAVRNLAIEQWSTSVRFRETIEAMHAAGIRIFVEVGPRGNLTNFITDTLRGKPHAAVPLDVQRTDGITQLCRAVGMLVAHGAGLDVEALYRRRAPRIVDLLGQPVQAPPEDPPLRLDLPTLTLDCETIEAWREHSPAVPLPPMTSKPLETPPAAPAMPTISPGVPPVAVSATATPSRSAQLTSAGPTPHNPVAATAMDARLRAYADYQQTMRQFLALQQKVMTAAATQTPAAITTPHMQPSLPMTPVPPPPSSENGIHADRPVTSASPIVPAIAPTSPAPAAPVVAKALATNGNGASAPRVSIPQAASGTASTESPLVDQASILDRLVRIVSERTGYPAEMLDLDANMEADLGIDSIKRVEVIGAIRREALPKSADPPEAVMERLTAARTLREVASGVVELSARGTKSAAPRPAGAPLATSAVAVSTTPAAPSSTAEQVESPELSAEVALAVSPFPFVEAVLVHEPGQRLVADCELDVEKHRFLQDHTFLGRRLSADEPDLIALPVLPMAGMLELLAEAAARLVPAYQVVAMSDVRTLRWVTFESDTRRLRIEANRTDEFTVRVALYEADVEGMAAAIAEGTVELAPTSASLGTPQVADRARTSVDWADDIYGWILFHGPAFHGVARLECCDADAVRATVHEPDATRLFASADPPALCVPMALIDVATQVPGMIYGRWHPDDSEVHMVYPNSFERLEFTELPPDEPLTCVATARREGQHLLTDLEVKTARDEVVLRIMGRRCQVVDFPTPIHHQSKSPTEVTCSRAISDLFAGVPGIEDCVVAEVARIQNPVLMERLWSQVLGRIILGREERRIFRELKTPPRETASWLMGRIAAKDAVRLRARTPLYLADVGILPDEFGRPLVRLSHGDAPHVSISHKGLEAVAVAAGAGSFRGAGIDMELAKPMPPELVEDTFTTAERALLDAAAAATGESPDLWYLSGWAAKESFGKALGRGVIGGPRTVAIQQIDAPRGTLWMDLHGPMAEAFPEFVSTPNRPVRLAAHRRIRENRVIALCLLPREV